MLPFGPGIGEVDKESVGSVFGGENIGEAGDVISGEAHVGFGAAVPQHFAVGVGKNGVDHVDAKEIGIGMRFGCGGDKIPFSASEFNIKRSGGIFKLVVPTAAKTKRISQINRAFVKFGFHPGFGS